MKQNLKVTVIIPVYNSEDKIEKCLDSVFSQTYAPYEVFVVDDGSNDKTLEVLKRCKKKYKKLKVLTQKRQGPGAAKNLAVKSAKGDILVFVDSDEYPKKDYVKKLVEPIIKKKAKTSVGAWYVARPENPWARCRFKDTYKIRQHALKSGVFRAVEKNYFLKSRKFDPSKGYSDDRIKLEEKRARVEDAVFYHDVDSSLHEIYEKRKWIGSSIKNNPKPLKFKIKLILGLIGFLALVYSLFLSVYAFIVLLVLLLVPIIYMTFYKVIFYKDIRLLFYYPFYLVVVGIGMLIGFLKKEYRS